MDPCEFVKLFGLSHGCRILPMISASFRSKAGCRVLEMMSVLSISATGLGSVPNFLRCSHFSRSTSQNAPLLNPKQIKAKMFTKNAAGLHHPKGFPDEIHCITQRSIFSATIFGLIPHVGVFEKILLFIPISSQVEHARPVFSEPWILLKESSVHHCQTKQRGLELLRHCIGNLVVQDHDWRQHTNHGEETHKVIWADTLICKQALSIQH